MWPPDQNEFDVPGLDFAKLIKYLQAGTKSKLSQIFIEMLKNVFMLKITS